MSNATAIDFQAQIMRLYELNKKQAETIKELRYEIERLSKPRQEVINQDYHDDTKEPWYDAQDRDAEWQSEWDRDNFNSPGRLPNE